MNETQKDEIEVLESMYPDEFEQISESHFRIKLPDNGIQFSFFFPKNYPEKEIPSLDSMRIEGFSSSENEEFEKKCKEYLQSIKGSECMFLLINYVIEEVEELKSEAMVQKEFKKSVPMELVGLYFDHIRGKKQKLIELAKSFGLSGLIKAGKPGYVLAYGEYEYIEKFIKITRSWSWKKFTIRFKKKGKFRFTKWQEVESANEIVAVLERLGHKDLFFELKHLRNQIEEKVKVPGCFSSTTTNSKEGAGGSGGGGQGVTVNFRVKPGAKKTEIEEIGDDCIRISVSKAAKNNQANNELLGYISRVVGVKRNKIRFVSGQKSRDKVLFFKKDAIDLYKSIKAELP